MSTDSIKERNHESDKDRLKRLNGLLIGTGIVIPETITREEFKAMYPDPKTDGFERPITFKQF